MYIQQCITCKKQFEDNIFIYTCPDCGDIEGTLDIKYAYEKVRPEMTRQSMQTASSESIFRYLPLLPVSSVKKNTTLKVGPTPLYKFPDLAHESGIAHLSIKDDSLNPSLSLKDRASIISLLKARELGFEVVTTASTGNAAASLACIGANLNFKTVIFVPESIPKPKLIQLQIFGSKIILVQGNYDDAFDLCRQVSDKKNWYNRSTAINPFNIEGKKTVAFEICEQLEFDLPDLVFVPVGDGSILSGVWKGFQEFHSIGLIERLPSLIACQSKGSAAIYNALKSDQLKPTSIKANTIADSISVDLPRDSIKALRALRQSNGDAVIISDHDIIEAQKKIARRKGIFCEPSAAAAFAGFLKYSETKNLKENTHALVLLTGSGMKDLATAEEIVKSDRLIYFDPEKDDIEDKLRNI